MKIDGRQVYLSSKEVEALLSSADSLNLPAEDIQRLKTKLLGTYQPTTTKRTGIRAQDRNRWRF